MAPEAWQPWQGSRTTSVNGAGAAVRRDEVAGRGMERTCHQTNDATMSKTPSHATMFFTAPPKPNRPRNIATFEDSRAVLRPPKFDTESRFCCRARARLLQLQR